MPLSIEVVDSLLADVREREDVEVKTWLDLTANAHKAALAKEIIALANHGEGYILIGFAERNGGFVADEPRPETLDAWTQDAVNGIVNAYTEPAPHREIVHRLSPLSGALHPVVYVPGGARVPVRARRASPDTAPAGERLTENRIYIRRPGPNSEEPRSAAEWDRLLERCVKSRQADLLDMFRAIMAGETPTAVEPTPDRAAELAAFADDARRRWESLVAPLPDWSPARLPEGRLEFGFAIDGPFDRPDMRGLRDVIAREVRNHSGWPVFVTIARPPHAPAVVDGAVESWIVPEPDGAVHSPSNCNFWRISPEGLMFTLRGYREDDLWDERPPGDGFDIVLPTLRLGEAVINAAAFAAAMNGRGADLVCTSRWTGLAGRELVNWGNTNRHLFPGRRSRQGEISTRGRIAVAAVPEALPELVHAMLEPVYQLFDFFDLPSASWKTNSGTSSASASERDGGAAALHRAPSGNRSASRALPPCDGGGGRPAGRRPAGQPDRRGSR